MECGVKETAVLAVLACMQVCVLAAGAGQGGVRACM